MNERDYREVAGNMASAVTVSSGRRHRAPASPMSLRIPLLGCALLAPAGILPASPAPRPNILWLTSEDHGIEMGCYGDPRATTPHVDALATRGLRYRFAWSNAPVCAPARTALITGLHPTATGAEHMRSAVPLPAGLVMYPRLMRDAGYYTTNNLKEDYNYQDPAEGKGWDESSGQAHWRNRPAGRPFFAIFNSTRSHESEIRRRPHVPVHDPAKMRVPAYHPDIPEVRRDWAQYYDRVSEADADAGRRLAELEAAGLAGDTIVFYYGDHGSGMPRSKRWPGNSGLRVPLVVYIPEKFRDLRPAGYRPGGVSDRLVSFVDLAPTLLSLAGIAPPEWMQGRAFLGPHAAAAPEYVHGFRGRVDEREDLVRSVTDGRYVYIRNYRPELPAGQYIDYQFQTPTTAAWHRMFAAGELNAVQSAFWRPRPAEELYDLEHDSDEVANLAGAPGFAAIKARLRAAQQAHALAIRDVGFLPEGELFSRRPGLSPYDLAREEGAYPLERVFALAELASLPSADAPGVFEESLDDPDSAVRYWAALGLARLGETGLPGLRRALGDESAPVRTVAAEALVRAGDARDRSAALEWLGASSDPARNPFFDAVAALAAIDRLGAKAAPILPRVQEYSAAGVVLPHPRYDIILQALLAHLKDGPAQ